MISKLLHALLFTITFMVTLAWAEETLEPVEVDFEDIDTADIMLDDLDYYISLAQFNYMVTDDEDEKEEALAYVNMLTGVRTTAVCKTCHTFNAKQLELQPYKVARKHTKVALEKKSCFECHDAEAIGDICCHMIVEPMESDEDEDEDEDEEKED